MKCYRRFCGAFEHNEHHTYGVVILSTGTFRSLPPTRW